MAERKRGPKPIDRAASTPSPGVPAYPPNLDAEARAHYRRLTGLMAESGLLSLLDYDALSIYMGLWSRWRRAEKEVRAKGMVIRAPNGWAQRNPYLDIATQCQRDMRPFLGLLGLSPAARSKLALPEVEEVDPKWQEPE